MNYKVVISKAALKDIKNLKSSGLLPKARTLLELLTENPFQSPPTFEKLYCELPNLYSRRINVQHRLVYSVDKASKIVRVARMWSHYE